jgi:hypothetical protein
MTICSSMNYFHIPLLSWTMIPAFHSRRRGVHLKCIRRELQAVFVMFIVSTLTLERALITSQQDRLYDPNVLAQREMEKRRSPLV